ncbi:uncharacterized protein [Cherax quadricarinatus]|uniref:uncharacterized protein n=1 Tax=Cherax quadricarinatus TaxID=27406 RepID=UPI00387E427B
MTEDKQTTDVVYTDFAKAFDKCDHECIATLLRAPVRSLDRDAILHIREHWVDQPAPRDSYKPGFPLDDPPWASNHYWKDAYNFINNYFNSYKIPGIFMEIGAQDGEYMSLTLFVEQQLGFRGVLVEPNPFDYQKLRSKGRSSYTINACATPHGGHRKERLWLRHIPDILPPLLYREHEGSNMLMQYVKAEDLELGEAVWVQCFNAGAMVLAALDTFMVDLLVISTHQGELQLLYSIPYTIQFRMVVMVLGVIFPEDANDLKEIAKSRGLTQVFQQQGVYIFIPSNEVKIV